MNPTCPRCGTTWHQAGNATGHCAACHRTFQGLGAFDRHQRIRDGRVVCRDPAAQVNRETGERLWRSFVDSQGAVVWRSADEYPAELRERQARARESSVAAPRGATNTPDPGPGATAHDSTPEQTLSGQEAAS